MKLVWLMLDRAFQQPGSPHQPGSPQQSGSPEQPGSLEQPGLIHPLGRSRCEQTIAPVHADAGTTRSSWFADSAREPARAAGGTACAYA